MPEVEQATQTAAIPSEPSSLGGDGGGLELSDEDILGITPEDTAPTATPAAAPEKTEEPAPAQEPEKKEEETPAPAAEQPDDLKWMRPLLNDRTFGPKLQSMHDRLLAFQELYPTVADARAVKELLPGGTEELKTLLAKSKEVDELDLQYFSHDPEEQKSFAQNLFRDDPEAFNGMVQIGLDIIRGQNPQEYAYLTQHLVGEALQTDNLWGFLEEVFGEASQVPGNERTIQWLHTAAGVLQKYGLGPKTPQNPETTLVNQQRSELERKYQQLQSERQRDFNSTVEQNVQANLDSEIGVQLQKLLPKTSEGLRGRIAKDIHSEIQKAVNGDARIKLHLSNLLRSGGINRQTQDQVINLIVSKAKVILPGAVKRVVNEYTASVMASRNEVKEKQNQAASRVDVSSGARPGTGVRPITHEEAKEMSDLDILNSSRPFVRRR